MAYQLRAGIQRGCCLVLSERGKETSAVIEGLKGARLTFAGDTGERDLEGYPIIYVGGCGHQHRFSSVFVTFPNGATLYQSANIT